MPTEADPDHLNNEPSGSVVPLPCQHSKDIWPTCYGYIRGHHPSHGRFKIDCGLGSCEGGVGSGCDTS